MKNYRIKTIATFLYLAIVASVINVKAQNAVKYDPVPKEITTPEEVKTHLGTLHFTDGYPTDNTAVAIQNELDYIDGVNVFMNTIQGVSMYALYKGFHEEFSFS